MTKQLVSILCNATPKAVKLTSAVPPPLSNSQQRVATSSIYSPITLITLSIPSITASQLLDTPLTTPHKPLNLLRNIATSSAPTPLSLILHNPYHVQLHWHRRSPTKRQPLWPLPRQQKDPLNLHPPPIPPRIPSIHHLRRSCGARRTCRPSRRTKTERSCGKNSARMEGTLGKWEG